MPRIALLFALLFVLGLSPAARAYQTQHVVIVVIDGGRYTETLGDTTFANEPNQGRIMAPMGCRTDSWNYGVTTTVAGHAAILSGI